VKKQRTCAKKRVIVLRVRTAECPICVSRLHAEAGAFTDPRTIIVQNQVSAGVLRA